MNSQLQSDVQRPSLVPYLLGFALVGMVLSASGPALSHMRRHVHTTDGGIALVFVAQGMGYVVASFLSGTYVDRGHGHRLWMVGVPVAVVGLSLAGAAPTLATLCVVWAFIGAAGGMCSTSANTLVMWSRPEGAGAGLNQLHLCFALGDLTTPVLMNRSLAWTRGTWGMAIPVALIGAVVLWLMARSSVPRRSARAEAEVPAGGRSVSPALLMVALFLTLYVALETGFTGWVHTFVEDLGKGSGVATGVLTVFWLGFVIGRAASSWLAHHLTPGRMVAGGVVGALVGAVALVVGRHGGPMMFVATFVFAIGVSPLYASMVAFAESRLRFTGRAASLLLGGAGLGGFALPWLMGQIFDSVGAKALPFVTLAMAGLVAVAAVGVRSALSVRR